MTTTLRSTLGNTKRSMQQDQMSMTAGGGTLISGPTMAPDDINFPAIMELMTSKYTEELVDRHVAEIRKVCKTCCNGFLLKHLDPLVDLLRLIVKRIAEGQYAFAPAICDVTRVASQPFVSCKASDMISYGHRLPDFVQVLVSVLNYVLPPTEEQAMAAAEAAAALAGTAPPSGPEAKQQAFEDHRASCERVRIEVAHTLACWSRFGLDEDSVELRPHQPLIQAIADSGTPNLRVLWQSEVADALANSFRSEDSPEAIVITLGAIRDMSLYRPLARQITQSGLILNLVHVIRVNILGSDVLLVAAEVLWNVLELDWEGSSEALGRAEVIECFHGFMDAVLSKGYRFKDKIFRNDMMVLLMYISKREENRSLFATHGLMKLLLAHAVGEANLKALEEGGSLQEGTLEAKGKSVVLTNSQEDMEFRFLLWGTLARCCSAPECADLAVQFGLVTFLLNTALDALEGHSEHRQWSQEQRRKVQLESLSALFQLVQYAPEAFTDANGSATVLQLLQLTRSREVQKKCLNLLQVVVRTKPSFSEELGQLGAVGVLIELFADRDNPMSSRQLCASVLAGLCAESSDNRREFRKKDGIEAMRQEVVYRPDETTDNHLFFTLCVVDCVWSAIVGTRKNEIRFLDAGGLFALLDVLEVAPLLLKRQIIGCLADLMLYRKAAKLFGQWNSQVTMKGAVKILMELWHSEQDAARSTGGDGVIRDLERPLNPKVLETAAEEREAQERPDTASSDASLRSHSRASSNLRQAINFADTAASHASMRSSKNGNFGNSPNAADAAQRTTATSAFQKTGGSFRAAGEAEISLIDKQDARAKIFAVLECVGFECQEALSVAERQQMEVVKLYPTASELEAWIEVRENLEARELKPVAADLAWMQDSIAQRKADASKVQDVQTHLAEELRSEETASLNRFYEDIRGRAQFRRAGTAQGEGNGSRMDTPGMYGIDSGDGPADDLDGGFSSEGF